MVPPFSAEWVENVVAKTMAGRIRSSRGVGESSRRSTEDDWTASSFDDLLEQGSVGADPAVVRSDLYQHALVRVQSPADKVDSGVRCHSCLEHEMSRL